MAFTIDKQTLDDLHIFGRSRSGGVYNLFNKTQTTGGAKLLEEMFLYPLPDAERIARRSAIIRYFQGRGTIFPFRNEQLDAIEFYLENTDERTMITAEEDTLKRTLNSYIKTDTTYELLHKGILSVIGMFNSLHDFLRDIDAGSAVPGGWSELGQMQVLLNDEQLNWMYEEKETRKLSYAKAARYDRVLRFTVREKIKQLLHHIYHLDVYISVARVAVERGFVTAQAMETKENMLRIEGMYHPLLATPVANSLSVDRNSHIIFLTGANMAGKSTFMKTLGIVLFLAHMGFPVPARQMEFAVQNGLFTTINLADNLSMGYSHFYAEVLRLKKVAEHVVRTEKTVVIFDELFRGTNVKDAYDATVAVTSAFAGLENCIFIISTHIIEAGEVLKEWHGNISFLYFPTEMDGLTPRYTYQLAPGITNDRHGMMIIQNERIIDTIRSRQNKVKEV